MNFALDMFNYGVWLIVIIVIIFLNRKHSFITIVTRLATGIGILALGIILYLYMQKYIHNRVLFGVISGGYLLLLGYFTWRICRMIKISRKNGEK
jgi:hypothetical protein